MMKKIFATAEQQELTHYILEEEYGFKLCVHNKDFIAGVPIGTSITNAVNLSRRVIILLTEYVQLCDNTENCIHHQRSNT